MKTKIARDSKNQIMWVCGRKDMSPLTYHEWKEGMDMKSGTITKIHTDQTFYPPFTLTEEELEVKPYVGNRKENLQAN